MVWPPTFKSLKSTRDKYPSTLGLFFTNLLKPKSHSPGENIQRASVSMSDDVVHSVSNGLVLTPKHTLIGCGIHSMTGLSKPIEILSRYNNS